MDDNRNCSKLCSTKEKVIFGFLFLPTAIFLIISIYILLCRFFILLKEFFNKHKRRKLELDEKKFREINKTMNITLENNFLHVFSSSYRIIFLFLLLIRQNEESTLSSIVDIKEENSIKICKSFVSSSSMGKTYETEL